jgi:spermidine synthase
MKMTEKIQHYTLEITVFTCGALGMTLEIVGSRVLAPYVGTSLFVWTSLIGVILGSLSFGYFWGGKLADKNASQKTLSKLIFLASLSVAFTAIINSLFLSSLTQLFSDIRLSSFLGALFLFAPASIFLGTVSPYAVKLKIKTLSTSGQLVGNLYALSTIGSIVGTFAAGFFLIAYLGTTKILFLLSISLVFTSFFVYFHSLIKTKTLSLIFLITCLILSQKISNSFENFGIIDIDTQYQRIMVVTTQEKDTNRNIRYLSTDPNTLQSAIYLDSDELVFDYTKYFHLAIHFNPNIKKALMIGGAAYSFPKDFLKKYPEATIDVVEIDPAITKVAQKYFNLQEDPRLTIYHEDGRIFLNNTQNLYDVIFIDAFQGQTPPYQLTTKETASKMNSLLNENGVILINIISSIEGEKGKFLRAEYTTYSSIFPQVKIFPVQDTNNGDKVQNIMFIAFKSPSDPVLSSLDSEFQDYLSHVWTEDLANDMPILTDDYAPVENYILETL